MRVEKLSDTVHHLYLNDQEIILIGTAHVSQNSVEEVRQIIEEVNPDRICLELDDGRMKSKTEEKSYGNTNLIKMFREGKGFLLLANTALASFQKRMGANANSKVGEEILIGATLAEEKGIPYSLCDRDIQTTFRRAWNKSSFYNKMKLITTLVSAAFSKEEISAEELEELKQEDVLQSMMKELAKELPTVKEVLIDERDMYLARSIFQTGGKKKVAIIGAGHTSGIIETLGQLDAEKAGLKTFKSVTVDLSKQVKKEEEIVEPIVSSEEVKTEDVPAEKTDADPVEIVEEVVAKEEVKPEEKIEEVVVEKQANKKVPNLDELSVIPSGGKGNKIIPWIIPALIVGLLVYGGFSAGWDQGLRLFIMWIIVNVSCTFITTLAAAAHPLNILCCAITAPFFALHPLLGVGMVGGILEATLRAPKVKDFENMSDDAMKLKGWYKNRILHCLLVFFLSSIGSVIGTFIAFPMIIANLA